MYSILCKDDCFFTFKHTSDEKPFLLQTIETNKYSATLKPVIWLVRTRLTMGSGLLVNVAITSQVCDKYDNVICANKGITAWQTWLRWPGLLLQSITHSVVYHLLKKSAIIKRRGYSHWNRYPNSEIINLFLLSQYPDLIMYSFYYFIRLFKDNNDTYGELVFPS